MNSCKWIDEGKFDNYIVYDIWRLIAAEPKMMFEFQWIPSHVGIMGNETADGLAVEGASAESCTGDLAHIILYCRKYKDIRSRYTFHQYDSTVQLYRQH